MLQKLNMVRNYVKKLRKYDDKALSDALREISNKSMSISKASKKYNIDRSFLSRRLHGKGTNKRGRKTDIEQQEEEKIAVCLKKLAQWGFGLTSEEVLDVVQEHISKNGLKTPQFIGGRPGYDWLKNFMKRHGMSLKKPELLEVSRRNVTSDPFIIYEFYDILETALNDLDLLDKPAQIFNLDETSFCHDPSRLKIVGKKGASAHRTTQGCGKLNTSVLACVNAAGKLLPPLIIFQGNNFLYINKNKNSKK